jgi:hypothetical protein
MTALVDGQSNKPAQPGPLDLHSSQFVLETFNRFIDALPNHPSHEAIVRTVLRLAWPITSAAMTS